MKKLLFFIISIFSVVNVCGQGADEQLVIANKFYTEGKYQEAVLAYENIIKSGSESSELYYNMGNAYYKQNIIAKAILNYEKALKLAPNNKDVKYNLELCNRLVVDQIEVLPIFFLTKWIRNTRNLFSSDFWALISISAFGIALLFISFYLYSKGIAFKKLSFWLGFVTLLVSFGSYLFSGQQKNQITEGGSAIIMSSSVTVKSSPDASGTDLFVIHEGTKVSIEDKLSDWKEVKLSDGSKGWLKTADIEII